MKYIIQARPYRDHDYTVRECDTIEKVHEYVAKEGCTIPCEYGMAGLVVYENGKRIECWTTPHVVEVLNW